ncbi:hypothetical protein H8D64_02370 [PVC group bacterium]|nr:hypothetical protein [PVC group bacterium]
MICKERNDTEHADTGKFAKAGAVAEEKMALYWTSLEKLKRMRERLTEHGFTSFAEA